MKSNYLLFCVHSSGISNKLVPIQIVHGFSPVENDRLADHLKQHQHQHQTLARGGHDFIKNTQQHVKTVPFGEIRSHSSSSSSSNSAKGLATADNIAISDVLSNEQMLYFSNENGNDNVKGNYAWTLDRWKLSVWCFSSFYRRMHTIQYNATQHNPLPFRNH